MNLLPFFLLACPLLFGEAADEDELVLVQALWRHGDRSPTGTFKTDIWQEKDWHQGWGQLSPTGMRQHVVLGKKLRKRYITDLGFLSGEYHNHEIYVRSTDFNRTLISAISNLIGFYGPGTKEDYPQDLGNDWPAAYVPIAVHTIPGKEDFVAPGDPDCPRERELKQLLRKTPEYQSYMAKHKWVLDFLGEKGGDGEVELFDIWKYEDVFFVEKLYNRKLVDWAEGNKTLLDAIHDLSVMTLKWENGIGLSPVDGVDFNTELPRIRGGPILWKMVGNMLDKLKCEKKMNAVLRVDPDLGGRKSPLGTPLCEWANQMKYFVYSAHDSTVAAMLSALGLTKTNNDREGLPTYSTCLTMELWRKKGTNQHYVKVLYWHPEDQGPMEINNVGGCPPNGCTLEQFVERSKKYQMQPSPQEFCKKPLKPNDDGKPKNAAFAPKSDWIYRFMMALAPLALAFVGFS